MEVRFLSSVQNAGVVEWFTRPPQKRLSKDMEVRLLLPVLDTIEVQMDERCPAKAEVVGPNPAGGAKIC